MANEVIYLSSDDETSKKLDNATTKKSSSQTSSTKQDDGKNRKAGFSAVNSPSTSDKSIKRRVCLTSQFFGSKPNKTKQKIQMSLHDAKPSTSGLQKIKKTPSQDLEIQKPLLVVREKHPVSMLNGNEDLFAAFIGQVFQRDRSDDMVKIVEKLKRRYEQLDPVYAKSEEFAELLNEKRDILLNQKSVLFKHISEVNEEMKKKKLGKRNHSNIDNQLVNGNKQDENQNESEEEEKVVDGHRDINRKNKEKIKKLEKCMEIVQRRINKLDAAEVDLDDETDSAFIKTERYKKRMVELYSLWCKYTNNDETANRSYLRPKHFNKLTGIVTVDQAINSFVNSRLALRRKKPANNDCEIFPDYIDILNVVHKHNIQNNIGMDKRAEREAAKSAFTKLGEYLQRVRREDLFDSFSTFYENDEDPIKKDPELASKFSENRIIGEKKMNAIFDEYTKKQENLKEKKSNEKTGDGKSESENDDNSEDEDDDDDDDDNDDEKDVSDAELMDISDADLEIDQRATVSDSKKQVNSPLETKDESKKTIVTSPDKKNNRDHENDDDLNDEDNDNENHNDINKHEEPVIMINSVQKKQTSLSIRNSESKTENQVDKIHDENGDSNKAVNEQPLLKLRSFAKPSTYWQNSQEGESSAEKIEQSSSKRAIEVIDIADAEEPPIKKSVAKKIVKVGPRIVKIIRKKVQLKTLPKEAIIVKSSMDSKVPPKHVRILPFDKTKNLNVTILKPSIATIGPSSKSNNSIVQSSAVSTTVNRVKNPMARDNSSNQQFVNILGVLYPVNNKIVNK